MPDKISVSTDIDPTVFDEAIQKAAGNWWERNRAGLEAEVDRTKTKLAKLDRRAQEDLDQLQDRLERRLTRGMVAIAVVLILGSASAVFLSLSGAVFQVNDSLLALQDRISAAHEKVRLADDELRKATDRLKEKTAEYEILDKRMAAFEQQYREKLEQLDRRSSAPR